MAKKSAKREPRGAPADAEQGSDRGKWAKKPVLFQVRGNPEFKAALLALADFEGIKSLSDLIDRAVRAYAREIKYPKQPLPKR